MADSENDEDLKKAIALSLMELSPSSRKAANATVDLTNSDDENDEDDLDAPVATHAKYPQLQSALTIQSKIEDKSEKPQVPSNPNNSMFGTLNRKQMEEERLARAAQRNKFADSKKRKASTSSPSSPQNDRRQTKALRPSSMVKGSYASGETTSISDSSLHPDPVSRPPQVPGTPFGAAQKNETNSPAEGNVAGLGVQFPHGTVKKTWASGYARHNDIKIEDVLQRTTVELAVLSSWQVDAEWIQTKLHPDTKVVWVLQAKTDFEKANYRSLAPRNFRFCFPSMQGAINCMHSKLQLLSHPTHLRIVIPSANLTPYDWGEDGGIMENTVFLIDIPRRADGERASDDQLTPFAKELIYFIGVMGLDTSIVESLRKFDFSNTNHLALIHSVGGSHFGSDMQRTGYCGLGKAVQDLGLKTDERLEIDFVTSSIGSLSDQFMISMYLAAQGDDGMKNSKADTPKELKLSDEIERSFRVYFPSRQTVEASKGGTDAAGTICFQPKWYDSNTFPKGLMRDCQSNREGLLMHNKMLFVRSQRTQLDSKSSQPIAWAYVGSANLSESAWGRMVKDRTTKQPKLNCNNWECGVLISVPGLSVSECTMESGAPTMAVFDGRIPVPMIVPGKKYESRRPWFYTK